MPMIGKLSQTVVRRALDPEPRVRPTVGLLDVLICVGVVVALASLFR